MKRYFGTDGQTVCVIDGKGTARDLKPVGDLAKFCSSAAFTWGRGGSYRDMGESHLALALCFDVLGDATRARAIYAAFKWSVVTRLSPSWELRESEILKHIEQLEAAQRTRTAVPSF